MDDIIAETNTTKAIILIIAITITTIAVSHREKSVMFIEKKVIALISIQTMSNGRQKNFKDKTDNSAEIKANTMQFWLIMKEIQIITLMMSMKKQIIQKRMMKIARNMSWLCIFLTNLLCIS